MNKYVYALCLLWLCYMVYQNWRDRKRWRERTQYAHCVCGERLSEWFLNEGLMWHPKYFGCGWISPWADHEDYRAVRGEGEPHGD